MNSSNSQAITTTKKNTTLPNQKRKASKFTSTDCLSKSMTYSIWPTKLSITNLGTGGLIRCLMGKRIKKSQVAIYTALEQIQSQKKTSYLEI